MRRDGQKWAAVAGGAALAIALWMPWFNRRLSGGVVPVTRARSVSGWQALGMSIGVAVLVGAALAIGWALRRGRASGVWLVVGGAVALLAAITATVNRIGLDHAGTPAAITTTPAGGLVLAFLGATAVVLAGLVALLRA